MRDFVIVRIRLADSGLWVGRVMEPSKVYFKDAHSLFIKRLFVVSTT
jgi:hypothetical protein